MTRRRPFYALKASALALIAIIALVPGYAPAKPPTLAQRIAAERRKAEALHERLHQKRSELNAATVKVQGLQSQLDETNSAISQVNSQLDTIEGQTDSTQRKATWNTVQLDAAQKSLALHDAALKRRLVDIYENGDLSYAAVLLSASSFSDFVERWEDLRLLINANERAVRARRDAERKVAAIQSDLQKTLVELANDQREQSQARSQLGALADERQNLVAVADQQRRHVAAQVAEMEDLSAAEEAQLEALIQEREREIEAQRIATQRAQGITGTLPESTGPGTFGWPVSGTITSPFGWRSNPFGGAPEFHQGLDIAAATGTTVTAAAAGTVLMAKWYGGYGNYILILHGGGYSTGYGHLSAIYVAEGQAVQRGQAIGAVGSTGESTGPHLHFEIRFNGKPIDPAPHLH